MYMYLMALILSGHDVIGCSAIFSMLGLYAMTDGSSDGAFQMDLWSMLRASFIVFTAFGSELVVWRYAGICSAKWCRNRDFFMQ